LLHHADFFAIPLPTHKIAAASPRPSAHSVA
jgi:hypothetical protein